MGKKGFIVVLTLLLSSLLVDCVEIKKKDKPARKPFKERIELLRKRVKRWHCHSPYGGGGGGFGGGGGGFGGGRGGGLGLLGGLGDMDPTSLVLLALMSGIGGGAVAPVGVGGVGGGIAPLPPSVPLKSNTPDPAAKSVDELVEELPAASGVETNKKPGGYVTPGNRCADSNECVLNAECVEALRQKYCVCLQGRRPKGGTCV